MAQCLTLTLAKRWRKNAPEAGRLLEADLEKALIVKLQSFLLELGKGFAFVARQQRICTESKNFYIDLVFYKTC